MTMWDMNAKREAIVQAIEGALPASGVPHHLRAGLVRYFSDGILPGSFLQAVLCNNLQLALARADPVAWAGLASIVTFLRTHAPDDAWGSRETVLAWTTTPDRLEI